MAEHLIKWANGKGYTLVLSSDDIDTLIDALRHIKGRLEDDVFEDLDISYSPILDEKV